MNTQKVYSQESLGPAHEAVLGMINPGARVLEVGCATGHMTRALTERLGCEVTAVELDARQAELARSYAQTMVVGDIAKKETWEDIQGTFDCVVFADVLEHLADPARALESAAGVLCEGGCVLASVPNIAYYKVRLDLLRGRFDYTDYGILDDSHLRFFTARSLRALFTEHDLRITDFRPIYRRRVLRRLDKLTAHAFAYQFVVRAVLAV